MKLVWAKFHERPWWPGIIINPNNIERNLVMLNVKKNKIKEIKNRPYGNNYFLIFLFGRKNSW
jgi:hypothetical protein